MNIKRIALPAAALAGALVLAACSGGDKNEQPAPTDNVENMTPIETPENTASVPTEAPAAPRIDNANTESAPAQTSLSSDEQTQDDADATGMTARVSRDEGGNEGQPAQ